MNDTRRLSGPGATLEPTPWWRVGIVWLFIGSTLAVVIAGIGMVRVAHDGADTALPYAPMAAGLGPIGTRPRAGVPIAQQQPRPRPAVDRASPVGH